jgi:ligand-binding sensor domain-containing protein
MRFAVSLLLSLMAAPAAFGLNPTRAISQYGHMMWTLQDGGLPGAPTSMTQTADGYLWVGTRNGLVRFDGVRFVPFAPPPGEELRTGRILSLHGSRDGGLRSSRIPTARSGSRESERQPVTSAALFAR